VILETSKDQEHADGNGESRRHDVSGDTVGSVGNMTC
jgi:hypothetical protein